MRHVLSLVALLFFLTPAVAQQQDVNTVAGLAQDLLDAQRAHLWRVGVWGGLNAASGLALLALSSKTDNPGRFGFGLQCAAWGLINVGIATAGLIGGPGDISSLLPGAMRAENNYADILAINLGLNVAYMSVGTTLLALSKQGVKHPQALRGHGSALLFQGMGLLVLDSMAFFGSRTRLADLIDLSESVSAFVSPNGFGFALTF